MDKKDTPIEKKSITGLIIIAVVGLILSIILAVVIIRAAEKKESKMNKQYEKSRMYL